MLLFDDEKVNYGTFYSKTRGDKTNVLFLVEHEAFMQIMQRGILSDIRSTFDILTKKYRLISNARI